MTEQTSPVSEEMERAFLHEIANKLTLAHGLTSILMNKIQGKSELLSEFQKLQKSFAALEEMSEIIKKRREIIIQHFSNH